MKASYLSSLFSFTMASIFLTTCQKPSRDNPWDELAEIDPQSWAPKNIIIETPTISQRTISWEYTGDNRIEGFKIDRKRGDENWVESYAKLGKFSRNFIDTISPDLNTTYYYKVYSYVGKLNSGAKEINGFAKIPAPSDLTLTKISDISYKLNWVDNSSGETGFIIERKSIGSDFIVLDTTTTNISSYIDQNVFNEKVENNLTYRIRAYYANYVSDFIVYSTIAAITAPTNLEISMHSFNSVSLDWVDNSDGEEGFLIERKYDENEWEKLTYQTSNVFQDTAFSLNVIVSYRVSAYFNNIHSDYAFNFFDSKLTAPTSLSVSRNSLTQVTLQWNDNNIGENRFRIERKYPYSDWEVVSEQIDSIFIDNSFSVNTLIDYRISSIYNSYSSDFLYFNFDSSIPPPTLTEINYLPNNKVEITWNTEYLGYSSFSIERKLNDGNYIQDLILINNPSQSSTVDTSINLELGRYTYRLIGKLYNDSSIPSNERIASAQLGMNLFGGYIFHLEGDIGGLVAGLIDISNSSQWGCLGTSIVGTSKNIGFGLQNSLLIIEGCPSAQIAAGLCLNFSDGKYDDWYLPSLYELELLYLVLKQNNIGNFRDSNYWSSSQVNSLRAFTIDFSTGFDGSWEKNYGLSTRAIRSFSF